LPTEEGYPVNSAAWRFTKNNTGDFMTKEIFGAFVALLALSDTAAGQSCSLPKIAVTAVLKQLPQSNLMTVPVEINGTPKQFLLDIGSNPTEVSQATVTELSLPESTKVSGGIQPVPIPGLLAGGIPLQAPIYETKGSRSREDLRTRVRVREFTMGSAKGRTMQFVVANDADMGKTIPYDGLLTGDFFRQYDVEIDFSGKQITYLTPNTCADRNQVVFWAHFEVAAVPMTTLGDKIQVPVTIDGHTLNAVIDTSSPRTVMRRDIAELTFNLKPDTSDMMPEGILKDGLGQQVYRHTFRNIGFEGVVADNFPMLIETNNMARDADRGVVLGSHAQSTDARIPDVTLGMDVLRQLHLYAVFGQKTLYVTAAQ
jgi:hypothetical protein